VKQNNFVPYNCNKVLKAAQCIHDNDKLIMQESGDYLQRASKLLRKQIGKTLFENQSSKVDETSSLILDGDGPRYVAKDRLASTSWRIILLYTYLRRNLFRDCLLCECRFERVIMAAVGSSQAAGNELTPLIPRRPNIWEEFAADVFESPAAAALQKKLIDELTSNSECKCMTIDGSSKPSFTLLGQASYRASKEIKAKQAIRPVEQKHAVLSGRGMTSAVLMLELLREENTENSVNAIEN
jgi:hypothetical protein